MLSVSVDISDSCLGGVLLIFVVYIHQHEVGAVLWKKINAENSTEKAQSYHVLLKKPTTMYAYLEWSMY